MMYNKKAVLISLGFHLILLFIAFFIKYEQTPVTIFKQIEILDFGISQPKIDSHFDDNLEEKTENVNTSSQIPEKINLPKSSIRYDNYPDYVSMPKKVSDKVLKTSNIDNDLHTKSSVYKGFNPELNENTDKGTVLDNNNFLNNLLFDIEAIETTYEQFILEGEIKNRKILKSILPEYPSGIEKVVSIKLQFFVNANGDVTNVIVIKKADPILEKIAIDSLKKWKFNAIPGSKSQSGFITFKFDLK